jgi:hypothetical protein
VVARGGGGTLGGRQLEGITAAKGCGGQRKWWHPTVRVVARRGAATPRVEQKQ